MLVESTQSSFPISRFVTTDPNHFHNCHFISEINNYKSRELYFNPILFFILCLYLIHIFGVIACSSLSRLGELLYTAFIDRSSLVPSFFSSSKQTWQRRLLRRFSVPFLHSFFLSFSRVAYFEIN